MSTVQQNIDRAKETITKIQTDIWTNFKKIELKFKLSLIAYIISIIAKSYSDKTIMSLISSVLFSATMYCAFDNNDIKQMIKNNKCIYGVERSVRHIIIMYVTILILHYICYIYFPKHEELSALKNTSLGLYFLALNAIYGMVGRKAIDVKEILNGSDNIISVMKKMIVLFGQMIINTSLLQSIFTENIIIKEGDSKSEAFKTFIELYTIAIMLYNMTSVSE